MSLVPDLDEFRRLARGGATIPVYREIAADLDTPVSAFLKLHRGGHGFLLESVEGGERWARYSLLGTDPLMTLRAKHGRLVARHRGGKEEVSEGDPLSALAACIATFAARALNERRLAWAIMGEPVDAEVDAMRLDFRQLLAAELETRIKAAIESRNLPDQDAGIAAPAIVGALMEGLLGPLAPSPSDDAGARASVQTATLLALRALGVIDARARGLVAQVALPE